MSRSKNSGNATRRAPRQLERSLVRRIYYILFTEPDASATFWCLAALAAWIFILVKWG